MAGILDGRNLENRSVPVQGADNKLVDDVALNSALTGHTHKITLGGNTTGTITLVNNGDQTLNITVTASAYSDNSDRLDGYHYSDILSMINNNGGIPIRGTSSFAGEGVAATVSIGQTLTSTNYFVIITPKTPDGPDIGRMGDFWVGTKGLSSFEVYNTGASTSDFEWGISKANPY